MLKHRYFITGIGTGIGKTITSAVITEKLKADYWKPIQSGDLHQSDSMSVGALLSNPKSKIHPETYKLHEPLSPHLSAKIDGVNINLDELKLPVTENHLIVEGAGGLMVPLNDEHLILDLIKHLNLELILVSKHYLGSINHTLLSVQALQSYNIPIKGIIFNGEPNRESEQYILNYTKLKKLGEIPNLPQLSPEQIFAATFGIDLE